MPPCGLPPTHTASRPATARRHPFLHGLSQRVRHLRHARFHTLAHLSEHPRRGLEPQSGVRHQQNVGALVDEEVGRRRHAGVEQPAVVRRVHDDRVDHHVRDRLGLQPYLPHDALEHLVYVGLDGEAYALSLPDRSDVALVHLSVYLHLFEIVRDHEERRRGEARGDRLSGLDVPHDHGAADRRADDGVLQIRARPVVRGAGGQHTRLSRLHGGLRVRELRVADEVVLVQLAFSLEVAHGLIVQGPGPDDARTSVPHRGREHGRVQTASTCPALTGSL